MIHCIVVDDEPIAVRALRSLLDCVPDVEVIASSSDAVEAYNLIRDRSPDLVFLDIEMPQLTGVEMIKALELPPFFIFTTAYREYAVEGFDLNAVDYLLKPISLPRLLRALEKYRRLNTAPAHEEENRTVEIRAERRNVRLNVSEIMYVESAGDYVKVYARDRVLLTKITITEMEDLLRDETFVRIHRSFLIAASHVTAFTSRSVEISGRVLPISRTYRETALRILRSKT